MGAWREAVQEAPGGVRLLVEVAAGAREGRFPDGFNSWRGRIGLRVRAPAREGQANQEACARVAAFLGVPAAGVTVDAGALDARKSLRVAGVAWPEAERRLAALLGDT